jgi:hypothetical protein
MHRRGGVSEVQPSSEGGVAATEHQTGYLGVPPSPCMPNELNRLEFQPQSWNMWRRAHGFHAIV